MSRCIPKILVEGAYFNIASCTSCKRIGMSYKNILSGFEPDDFACFSKNIIETTFEKYAVPFPPEGDLRIVIKTCHNDIQFSFDGPEFTELQHLLQQSRLLLEVERMLH